jgi:hypothetical protein
MRPHAKSKNDPFLLMEKQIAELIFSYIHRDRVDINFSILPENVLARTYPSIINMSLIEFDTIKLNIPSNLCGKRTLGYICRHELAHILDYWQNGHTSHGFSFFNILNRLEPDKELVKSEKKLYWIREKV